MTHGSCMHALRSEWPFIIIIIIMVRACSGVCEMLGGGCEVVGGCLTVIDGWRGIV